MKCKECGSILMSDQIVNNDDLPLCEECRSNQEASVGIFGINAFVEDDYRTAEEVIYGTI